MRLFIPAEYLEQVTDVQFRFAYKAYGTTYNPNYLGGYMAMIFPIIFVKYLFTRTTRDTIIWLAALIISLAGFFAPTSIGAFIAAGLALLIFLILTFRDFRNYYKKLLLALVVLIVVAGFSEVLSGGKITQKVSSVYRATFEKEMENDTGKEPAPQVSVSKPAVAGEEEIEIQIYRNPLDRLGSNRVYIWRKSLQMMKDNIILGSGLDTYVYNFPHWDPERDHALFRMGLLIDKPHNTYIQIATGVGVLGILVYLYVLFLHLKKYLQAFSLKGLKEESDIIMLALFIGWLGYLFQGLSNDSVLSNAPVFWALFGLSVNYVKSALTAVEEGKEGANKLRKEYGRKRTQAKLAKPEKLAKPAKSAKKEPLAKKVKAGAAGVKPVGKPKKK